VDKNKNFHLNEYEYIPPSKDDVVAHLRRKSFRIRHMYMTMSEFPTV